MEESVVRITSATEAEVVMSDSQAIRCLESVLFIDSIFSKRFKSVDCNVDYASNNV